MTDPLATIADERLRNQCLSQTRRDGPPDLVAWLGAVQAQEYPFAKWALALRLRRQTTEGEIERALDEGRILRTHVLRPTWHFVTPDDIVWMLQLTAPRVHRVMASYNRRQELDTRTLNRATTLVERRLSGGTCLTRAELGGHLERAGIAVSSVRLALLMLYAELEGVICSGPRRGKHFTYALVAERAALARRLSREEALAELTRRYFASHGPATIRDFVWWSGLPTADAKQGLAMIGAGHRRIDGLTYWSVGPARGRARHGGAVHLLPIYDEYLVAYRDRVAVPHGPGTVRSASGPVLFQHALVIGGQIAGTWRTRPSASARAVDVVPLRRLTRAERHAIDVAAAAYGRFLGVPLVVR